MKQAKHQNRRPRKKAKPRPPMLAYFAAGIAIGTALCIVVPWARRSSEQESSGSAEKNAPALSETPPSRNEAPIIEKEHSVSRNEAAFRSVAKRKEQSSKQDSEPSAAPSGETALDSALSVPSATEPSATVPSVTEKPQSAEKQKAAPSASHLSEERSQEEAAAWDYPAAAGGARLAFVFDDAGSDVEALHRCLALPFPVTVAVMPGLSHSKQCADEARKAGALVLLHQPMQAQNLDIKPGPLAITPEMTAQEAAALVVRNMDSLGGVAGVNNHEGSLITENEAVMEAILQAVHSKGAFFLDSRTTSGTKVPAASENTSIPYYARDVFLDNSHDKEAILEQVRSALDKSNKDGAVIMIGHVRADDALVNVLQEIEPSLRKAGYVFCTVSACNARGST